MRRRLLWAVLFSVGLHAQTVMPPPFVRASGHASVFVQPDQAKIDITVTAQGTTAQQASGQDATQVAAVLSALNMLLGAGADIKTVNYSVSPVYKLSSPGGPSVVVGYSASTTEEVTLNMISLAGSVIDTATGAGATSVDGVRVGLQDSEPAHQQALRTATLQAKAHADAMAGALGRTSGSVISVEEASATIVPIVAGVAAASAGAPTQVLPGLIEVRGDVVLQIALN